MRIGAGFRWDREDRMQCWYGVTDITYDQGVWVTICSI